MKLSALICVYEKDVPIYFDQALNSIILQVSLPNQIVIVIDGPINALLKGLIEKYKLLSKAEGIEYKDIWIEKNSGHGVARKIGIENCRYDLVAINDADDLSHKNRYLLQKKYFEEHKDISIVGAQIAEVNHSDLVVMAKKNVPILHYDICKYLKSRCPFNQMSVMFKKKDVLVAGNYIDFYHNEDYFLWIRMYLKGFKFANLTEVLVDARVNPVFYDRRGGFKYFLSESSIQTLMLKEGVISAPRWLLNIVIRLVIQVFMPPSVRGFIFRLMFRGKVD